MCDFETAHHSDAGTGKTTAHRIPDLYMPAMPPLGLIAAIENWVRARRRWERESFTQEGHGTHLAG